MRLLGGDAIAVFPLGGPNGIEVEQLLKEEKIDYRPLAIAGLPRESFTVDERQTGQQFRFIMAGPTLTEIEQERCLDQISSLEPKPAYTLWAAAACLRECPRTSMLVSVSGPRDSAPD